MAAATKVETFAVTLELNKEEAEVLRELSGMGIPSGMGSADPLYSIFCALESVVGRTSRYRMTSRDGAEVDAYRFRRTA